MFKIHVSEHIPVMTSGRMAVFNMLKTHAVGHVHVSCSEKREQLEMYKTPAMNPMLVGMEAFSEL